MFSLALIACGKKGSSDGTSSASSEDTKSTQTASATAPKGGSCTRPKDGTCTEFADNTLGLAEGACKELFHGTYAKSACSTKDLMATCQKKEDKQFYYFGGAHSPWVSDAKKDCEEGLTPGKFSAEAGAEETAKQKAMPSADKISASCVHQSGRCDDYHGDQDDTNKQICEMISEDKYESKACPSENLVASCVKMGKVTRYYQKDLKFQKLADLKTECETDILLGHFYPSSSAPSSNAPSPQQAKASPVPQAKAAPPKGKK